MTAGAQPSGSGRVQGGRQDGPRWAAEAVALVATGPARGDRGVRLDYSVRSLVLVDRIVESARRQNTPYEKVAGVLLGFGAYTGEVLVKAAGAQWVDFDEAQQCFFGRPFGVRTPDGRVWNPLGKAFKRFRHGPEESLHRFCLAVMGQARI
ncbi:hypothetical protein [Actinacidiphila rubida]|uniref:Uncharacterized protein n=1 Tax=Actinacidiphila rubida TaxID=310780 RepID=A0A1H8JFY3_9ACTN|nr:hypothetical protein [Actinacidiphila rubida]SEN79753.1 hypothetical protein SAMN05216267_1010104 [Actinacidiphila rubida]